MKVRLQTKTTLTIALLVVLVLTASSYLFYDTAKRALDAEMGERLVAVAKTSAAQLNGSYLRALQPGSEGTRLYRTLQKKLQSMRDASEAQAMYVLDLKYKSLVDSRLDVPIGSQYHSLGEDRIHIDQAKQGIGAASVAFHGKDDAFYRSAYAPIRDEHGGIVAILAVDASVLFLESLARMSRNMVLIGVVGMVFAVVLSIFLARSIVVPIERLSQATQQIKAGAFGTQVETRRSPTTIKVPERGLPSRLGGWGIRPMLHLTERMRSPRSGSILSIWPWSISRCQRRPGSKSSQPLPRPRPKRVS